MTECDKTGLAALIAAYPGPAALFMLAPWVRPC